jgi:gliding motility-associated-like protein
MASGPFVYFWSSLTQTTSVVSGIFPGNYTVSVSYNNGNCVYTTTTSIGSTTVFTGTVSSTPSVGCNGAGTGTAAITISGGTGNYNYSWTSGSNSATVSGLYAGTYAVTVSDAVTFCSTNQTFTITQPPPLSLTTSAVSSTACAGKSTTVSASASGGTPGGGPGYTYSWASGPSTTSFAVSQPIAGQYGYNVTASDANNCTITAVQFINFIQNPVITVANASICPQQSGVLIASGANTYTWTGGAVSNGSFSASPATTTTYTLIGTAQSCTSSGSGTIVVKPVPTPTISTNTPVCNGQVLLLTAGGGSTYKWQGPASYTSTLQNPTVNPVPVTLSGVFTVIATAANSCTAAVTSSVTVYPSPTISASGSTVCSSQTLQLTANSAAGSTYTWVGPGYSSTQQNPSIPHPLAGYSGNFSVYVTSAQGCTNIATTNVTVTEMPQLFPASNSPRCSGQNLNFSVNNINGGSYSWNGPNAFISGLQSPQINSVSVQAGGLYTLFVNLGPCLASTVIPAIVNALPVPTVSSNSPVCETKSLVLGVSCPNINTYFWSGPLGFTDHTPNTGRDSCALTFAGNYTIIVTDNNHCSSFATTNVIINRNPIVTATGATVCYKDPALLKGDGAVSYSWYTPAGLYSNQTNAVIAQALNVSPVVYTVIGTALNTCTSSATCTLQTTPLPQPSIKVFPSNKQCLNQVFTLQGSGAYSYDWVGPNRFQFAGTTVSLIASNLAFSGIYTLTAKDLRGCHAMTTTSLQVYPLPGGELDGVINSCAPFQSTFQFYPSALSASITNTSWYINSNPLFNDINHFSYTFNSPGNYVIKGSFTDLNSCVNTVSYVVTAYGQPVANFTFSPETPVETIDDVLFQNTSQGNIKKLSWFYGDNILTDKNKEVTSHLFDDAGTYPIALVVENEFGCLDSIVKPIVIAEDFHLFVPDVFSPNGDGLNDVFIPVTRGIKFYNLQIFDRWGIKIFETPNREVGWDGTTHGKISPEGVYVWRIEVSSRGGEQKTLTGHITLYR